MKDKTKEIIGRIVLLTLGVLFTVGGLYFHAIELNKDNPEFLLMAFPIFFIAGGLALLGIFLGTFPKMGRILFSVKEESI